MGASGRRRSLVVGGAFLAAVAMVLAVTLPLSASRAAPAGADAAGTEATIAIATGGGGRQPTGHGDAVCGDVRFDRASLPGRTVTPANGDWPTAAAADLLRLHGWPRAVPFDVAHWTVVLTGDAGVLVAALPGSGFHYLPMHRKAAGGWSVGRPCTPR